MYVLAEVQRIGCMHVVVGQHAAAQVTTRSLAAMRECRVTPWFGAIPHGALVLVDAVAAANK